MNHPETPAMTAGEVKGRYPVRPRALKTENIEVLVTEREPGVWILRLDDRGNDEFWLQLTVRLGEGAPCKSDC